MDVYMPAGDTMTGRPAIIFAHGGGFVTGSKNHDDMMAFCDSFAKLGYVTVTIDYRQGVYAVSSADLHYTRAVYRGIQDGRAVIRFLRANADSLGIDPDMIYFAGSSAGAFMCLQSIYMDDPSEKPIYAGVVNYTDPLNAPYSFSGTDLGAFDIGENLTYSGEPNGIMSLWGGVASTALITASNNEPVFLIHGTADDIVPFTSGSPFGVPTFPVTYGSSRINNKLDSIGLSEKETYFVTGAGHEFYGVTNGMWDDTTGGNAYWDTIVWLAEDFFWSIHKPNGNFGWFSNALELSFSDSTQGAVKWHWSFGDGDMSALQNPVHTYLLEGNYNVSLYVENSFASYDTITKSVNVAVAGIENKYEEVCIVDIGKDRYIVKFASEVKNADIYIIDTAGRTIKNIKNFTGIEAYFDSKNMKTGIYYIKISSLKKPIKISLIK